MADPSTARTVDRRSSGKGCEPVEELRYALDKVDEAERAVFALKLAIRDEIRRSAHKKRDALLSEELPVETVHRSLKTIITDIMDISDRLAPFYDNDNDTGEGVVIT